MNRRFIWVMAVVVLAGCGSDNGLIQGARQFVSSEFNFEISVTEAMDQAGWFIIREQDAALPHVYTPPDSSDWEPVAVVVPPGNSFPNLAPFNVDIFRMKNAATTAKDLADIRVAQVGDLLQSRRSVTVGNQPAEEVIYRQRSEVVYETYLVRNGIGYSINALGAPQGTPGAGFVVSVQAYEQVVRSFRFLEP